MPLRTCRRQAPACSVTACGARRSISAMEQLLKLVRRRAGIGDGLEICGNEARVLAALGGRPARSVWTFRGSFPSGTFAPHSSAAAHGYAAWLRLTRVAGKPFGEVRLARLSDRERDRFAASLGEAIATMQSEANGRSAAPPSSMIASARCSPAWRPPIRRTASSAPRCSARLDAMPDAAPSRLRPRRRPSFQSAGRRGRAGLRRHRFRRGRPRLPGDRSGVPALAAADRGRCEAQLRDRGRPHRRGRLPPRAAPSTP